MILITQVIVYTVFWIYFRYAGIINGFVNTLASVPGTFAPFVTGIIVQEVSPQKFPFEVGSTLHCFKDAYEYMIMNTLLYPI